MRRAILAVTLGGVLLTGAACDSDPGSGGTAAAPPPSPTVTASSAPASPPPDYSADTKLVCGRLSKIFSADLKDFGAELGKMIAYKEAKQADEAQAAQQAAATELRGVGAAVKKETAKADDPALREAGATSAAKFVKTAGQDSFFDKFKNTKDLDKVLQGPLTEWLTPVAGYCA